jgi:hypothetical protein
VDNLAVSRIENSSGRDFDLLWAGANAMNIPKVTVIVGNASSNIILSSAPEWSIVNGVLRMMLIGHERSQCIVEVCLSWVATW